MNTGERSGGVDLGRQTLRGVLKRSKGDHLVVEGVFLLVEDRARRLELLALVGKEVEASGRCVRYAFDFDEQSPQEGYMDFLEGFELTTPHECHRDDERR